MAAESEVSGWSQRGPSEAGGAFTAITGPAPKAGLQRALPLVLAEKETERIVGSVLRRLCPRPPWR